MQWKTFKARKRVFFIVTCAICALMAVFSSLGIIKNYPDEDITVWVMLVVLSCVSFMCIFPVLQMKILISDSEMIRKVLFFNSKIRFKDVQECYVVNGRILSFYMNDGRECKYALYGYEDPEGICYELRKHIRVE